MMKIPVGHAMPLLHFRAGRLTLKDGMVTADPRQGYLIFLPRTVDSLEMMWTDNVTQNVVVVPKGKTTVKFAEKCTTGRVLVFEVRAREEAPETYFFWLQDKATDKDEEYLRRTREILAASEPSRGRGAPVVQLDDFKKMLANITNEAGEEFNLVDVIASRKVAEALQADTAFFESRLRDVLPPIEGTTLGSEVQNTHIYAAARLLDAALRDSSTYRQLCDQLGVESAGAECGVRSFVKAVQKAAKKK